MVFVPPPLITHDCDFRATEDCINTLRDRVDHSASWKDPQLLSTDEKVTANIEYIPVSEFLTANQLPKVANQQKRLKVREEYSSDLPALMISLVKSIYLLQRAITPEQFTRIQPSYLTHYSGKSHDRAFYRRAVNTYVSNLEREILKRMRDVASAMIAEAIGTDRFKAICRSDRARQGLELFFVQSATNDQLYYVYSKLWMAVNFGFVMDNNVRPNAQEEQVRKNVRQIIKWGFGFAAADYFSLCIQRIGIPVCFSDDEDLDNETLGTNTLVDEENERWEDHDAIQYDHDQARRDFGNGWKQLVNNWNMATYSHSHLAAVSKDAGRLPATEMFDPGRTRELGEEGLV
ncbi:hypothetical protein BCON_0190g00110 [Botryotinia convoluta]|uniref:Uncharacterized protein n=1 Tax=Botryotinia convoluta TaxID=54673 RepID=A0A4Z1HM17_9HELO|nr:hypothetical protein BCON_0190g00110 [Botryotinia convoluta]